MKVTNYCEHGHCYAALPPATLRDAIRGYQVCPNSDFHRRAIYDGEKEEIARRVDERLDALMQAVVMLGRVLDITRPPEGRPTLEEWQALMKRATEL